MADTNETRPEVDANVLIKSATVEHSEQQHSSKAKKRRNRRKTRNERFKEKQVRVDYAPIVKENDNLISYYKQQRFVKEDEFETFVRGLRETLPASFRINTFDIGQAVFLRSHIEGPVMKELMKYVKETEENELEDSKDIEKCHASVDCLKWYPKRLAWQMKITRLDLRKIPILQQLHKFLMAETDNGFISRQESVSMIPPLLLDVKKGHHILDMCAAPGSKTAQLLEYLKSGQLTHNNEPLFMHSKSNSKNDFNNGMVVANDVDNKRCYMLVHQSNRLNSPNCIIINEDASRISHVKLTDDTNRAYPLKFDRILCDVPCSGDGTIRKNPDVWKKWTVGNANNFHGLQCKILRRGLELLKKDGLLVYSTCSMNPVEDEAVISAILRSSNDGVVIEDAASKLPNLIRRPGLTNWTVMNRDMKVVPSFDEVPSDQTSFMYQSLFPPKSEEIEQFHLERCIRILPHFQNTGGFFVVLLKKLVDKLAWETDELINESGDVSNQKPKTERKKRYGGFKEDPFIFLDENDPDWQVIKHAFGFNDQFPVNQLVHRCRSGKKRSIYLVSKTCRSFILANQEEDGKKEFVKIINGGMRLFNRAASEVGYRICQDGIPEVVDFIKDDLKVPIEHNDLVLLLKHRKVNIDLMNKVAAEKVKLTVKPGSFVLIFKHSVNDGDKTSAEVELPLVAWKGDVSVSLYVSDKFRVHLSALLGLSLDETCIRETAK